MRIIELRKDFGEFTLEVRGLTLEQGLIHGLIGPNGCGKTTLAKLIMGTVQADCAEVDLCGLSEREITMASQKPYMMRDTVYNNLVYPLKVRSRKADVSETARCLELCGLTGRERAYAPSLSSGQQQKLSFARALIFKPKLVIIDESFSNLDLDSVEAFEREILRIQETEPVTWIIISHQMAHIRRLCDRVHFMHAGRVLRSGTPEEVFDDASVREPELVRFLRHEYLSEPRKK